MARAEPTEPATGLVVVGEGVQARAATAKEAQDENNRVMEAILGRVKALGIGDDEIRTDGISLFPVNEPPDGRVVGHQATNAVRMTRRDPRRVREAIEAAVSAEANHAGEVRFALRDEAPLRRQALDQALRAAKGDAEAIAQTAGLRLGAVRSVTTEPSVGPTSGAGLPVQVHAPTAPPVQPGQLAVVARVRVVYQVQ